MSGVCPASRGGWGRRLRAHLRQYLRPLDAAACLHRPAAASVGHTVQQVTHDGSLSALLRFARLMFLAALLMYPLPTIIEAT